MHHKGTLTVGTAAGRPYHIQCSCGTAGDFPKEGEARAWFGNAHVSRLGPTDTSELHVPGAAAKPAAKPVASKAPPAAAPKPAAKPPVLAAPTTKGPTVAAKHHKTTLTVGKAPGRPYHAECACGAGGDFAVEKQAVDWYHAHNANRAAGETKELHVPGAKKGK